MYVYHVVTERPLSVGQKLVFDSEHHNGVYQRVCNKLNIVEQIHADPEKYKGISFEHHTAVALRELALEEVRTAEFPDFPSRMSCLYVSRTLEEAQNWADYFVKLGRPTYSIVRLKVEGKCFCADASKCFDGCANKAENLRLAKLYWENDENSRSDGYVAEMLADGAITVTEIVKEINENL